MKPIQQSGLMSKPFATHDQPQQGQQLNQGEVPSTQNAVEALLAQLSQFQQIVVSQNQSNILLVKRIHELEQVTYSRKASKKSLKSQQNESIGSQVCEDSAQLSRIQHDEYQSESMIALKLSMERDETISYLESTISELHKLLEHYRSNLQKYQTITKEKWVNREKEINSLLNKEIEHKESAEREAMINELNSTIRELTDENFRLQDSEDSFKIELNITKAHRDDLNRLNKDLTVKNKALLAEIQQIIIKQEGQNLQAARASGFLMADRLRLRGAAKSQILNQQETFGSLSRFQSSRVSEMPRGERQSVRLGQQNSDLEFEQLAQRLSYELEYSRQENQRLEVEVNRLNGQLFTKGKKLIKLKKNIYDLEMANRTLIAQINNIAPGRYPANVLPGTIIHQTTLSTFNAGMSNMNSITLNESRLERSQSIELKKQGMQSIQRPSLQNDTRAKGPVLSRQKTHKNTIYLPQRNSFQNDEAERLNEDNAVSSPIAPCTTERNQNSRLSSANDRISQFQLEQGGSIK